MIIATNNWSTNQIPPEVDACEVCIETCEYCCNKRPLQTWFIVLLLWASAVTSVVYIFNETDDLCEACIVMCEYCCGKRPVQSWFIVLTLWTTAIASFVYLSTKQKHHTGRFVNRCRSPLDQTDDTNAIAVLNYPLGDSAPYLSALGLNDKEYSYSPNYTYLVITTVTSQNLFMRTIKLVKHLRQNIMPKFNKTKLVIFDTDLTAAAHAILEDDCQCEVKIFPVQTFPDFIKTYPDAWQPLAIQILLKEYSFVIWIDPTTNLSQETLSKAIGIANKTGIAASYAVSPGQTTLSLGEEINQKTLEALGEVQCAFKGVRKFTTSLLLIYEDNSGFISRYIMRPWVSCALTKGCMSSEDNSEICSGSSQQCYNGANLVLSVILHRLYYNDFRDHNKFPFEII